MTGNEGTTSVNREIKDVFYLLALQGLNYIAPLLVLPYLMKVLGAEKFGYIGFSLSVMMYLMLIVDFGFNFSATKKNCFGKRQANGVVANRNVCVLMWWYGRKFIVKVNK